MAPGGPQKGDRKRNAIASQLGIEFCIGPFTNRVIPSSSERTWNGSLQPSDLVTIGKKKDESIRWHIDVFLGRAASSNGEYRYCCGTLWELTTDRVSEHIDRPDLKHKPERIRH